MTPPTEKGGRSHQRDLHRFPKGALSSELLTDCSQGRGRCFVHPFFCPPSPCVSYANVRNHYGPYAYCS